MFKNVTIPNSNTLTEAKVSKEAEESTHLTLTIILAMKLVQFFILHLDI